MEKFPCLLILFLMCICDTNDAQNKNLYCQACKAIISEIEYNVSKIDPKKTIDVGSYRVNPDGKTRTIQKVYARSEAFLTGVLENTCQEVSNHYVESKDEDTGLLILRRLITHEGEPAANEDELLQDTTKNEASEALSKKIELACETIVEDYEDEILRHFKNGLEDGVQQICADITGYCTNEVKDEL